LLSGFITIIGGVHIAKTLLNDGMTLPKLEGAGCKGVWLHMLGEKTTKSKAALHPSVKELVEEFNDVFKEPKGLPPSWSHDHQIILHEGAKPTCVRPYWYPYYQNEEIERLVGEMLNTGVIRPSQSPYSSPVLLVRKADGSWRMCVDYRALNQETIKDKYPIPNIDELLDKLFGAVIFSKFNLRSGYHQIRLKPNDVQRLLFERMKDTTNS
jgi:hypothetical protein